MARVLGITFKASLNSEMAICYLVLNFLQNSSKWMLKATSTAPPPATTSFDSRVLLATQMESCNDLNLNGILPLHFIQHIFVGTPQDNSAGWRFFAPFKENEIIIANCFLNNFLTLSEVRCIEVFLTFWCGHSRNYSCTCQLGDSLKISFVNSPQANASCFYKIFWC